MYAAVHMLFKRPWKIHRILFWKDKRLFWCCSNKQNQTNPLCIPICKSGIRTVNFLEFTAFQKRPSCLKAMHEARFDDKEFKLSELNLLDFKCLICPVLGGRGGRLHFIMCDCVFIKTKAKNFQTNFWYEEVMLYKWSLFPMSHAASTLLWGWMGFTDICAPQCKNI